MKSGMSTAEPQAETESSAPIGSVRGGEQAIPHPARASHTVELRGPAGRLEAILNAGAPDAPFAALICHPHPVYGGDLHNKVVYRAMKVFNDPAWGFGWPVLRFNFRGAGLSQGKHDGQAETADVLAALDWLAREFGKPVIVCGYSFGAAMALEACCGAQAANHDIRALALLGLPANVDGRQYQYSFLHNTSAAKLFLSGDRDCFASPAELAHIVDAAPAPRHLALIPGADHFFTDAIEAMQLALARWIQEHVQ